MSGLVLILPLAFALVAEAAWIAVLAGALDAFALHPPITGVPELLVVAIVGLLASRLLGPRLGDRWARVAVVLAALAGVLGWLASPEARTLLRADGVDGIGPALAANPGGWLAALAFVRGMAHARLPVDPERIGTMLAAGIPGLALLAIVGGMIAEPWRGAFLAAAQVQVLLFLVCAIAALALARLGQVGLGTHIDARRNPAWLVLLGALVIATMGLAIAVGAVAGSTIATIVGALVVPLLIVGFVVGFDRRSLRILFISVMAMGLLGLAIRTLTSSSTPLPGGLVTVPVPETDGNPDAQTGIALGLLAAVLIVAVIVVMLLARLWLRRSGGASTADDEIRVIDHGGEQEGPRRRRARRFGRREPAPTDAVGAYLALLASLDGREPVARGPGETPSEHARRLRAAGHGTLPLDLLAADVGLVRFAGATLPSTEDRRAVERADRARRSLLLVPVEHAAPDPAGAKAGPSGPVTRGGRRAQGPGADVLGQDDPGNRNALLNRIRRGF